MTHTEQLFEGRYGEGAFERLLDMLQQPCVTFAAIARRFHVSRERVRQWQLEFRPDAPRGHERQRLCVAQRSKRELFQQPLFRDFYRHARAHVEPRHLSLVRARHGFRRTVVRLDTQLIAIRHGRPTRDDSGQRAHFLTPCSARVDFVYYQLGDDDFMVVPREALPPSGALYRADGQSRYERFRNTFDAVSRESRLARQAS